MEQIGFYSVDDEKYEAFKEKFEPKKTTDDCYTPQHVYDAVLNWAVEEYGIDRESVVRPFWPGGDYENFEYPEGSVVVDNPPFSIIAKIIRFYCRRGIRFLLFAPALTLFTATECDVCYLPIGASLTYENGAQVATSFITNLDEYRVRVAPKLFQAVEAANAATLARIRKTVPKYAYPKEVITAAICQRWAKWGVAAAFADEECIYTNALDSQKEAGKCIFGGGYLLRGEAAAAAAAAAAAEEWPLSEREKRMIGIETEEKEQISLF